MHRHFSIALVVLLASVIGCEEKPPLPPEVEAPSLDTAYVQLFPSYGGFGAAQDVMVGNDQLLYVADTDSNRVIMLNRAGQRLSSRRMLRPVSLAQDTRLDLLVGGEMVETNGDTIGAIFRIKLVEVGHRLDLARVDTIWRERARPRRRFPGITVFGDNVYLVVRNGPDNSSFVDPDARVLLFEANDLFITPVPAFTSGQGTGGGISTIFKPTAIASFPGVRDFVLTQSSGDSLIRIQYGALWMRYERSPDFEGWLPRLNPERPEDRSVDFIRPNRYAQPEAVAIDRARRDIFIADAELDSVFKYNSRGRLMPESFGFFRTNGQMRRPTGLAYFERILYVLDAERGEVLRFRLTTDVPR